MMRRHEKIKNHRIDHLQQYYIIASAGITDGRWYYFSKVVIIKLHDITICTISYIVGTCRCENGSGIPLKNPTRVRTKYQYIYIWHIQTKYRDFYIGGWEEGGEKIRNSWHSFGVDFALSANVSSVFRPADRRHCTRWDARSLFII